MKRFILRALRFVLVFYVIIVLSQDILLFPGALIGAFSLDNKNPELPANVKSGFVTTTDNKRINFWELAPEQVDESQPVAIVFHGNGGTVENFFPIQTWLRDIGLVSYGFDYRGFGRSSGWPSEAGIYLDAEAMLSHVKKEHSIQDNQVILVSISIGSGPASNLALSHPPKALVLLSPLQSIADSIKDHILYKWFRPFSWYEFPVEKNVSNLKNSCVIVAYGLKDKIIPPKQSEAVWKSASVNNQSFKVKNAKAGHNDLFYRVKKPVETYLNECLKER